MNILIAALTGLLFGIGLIIAGMANPAKVLGFLDIAGNWDPSLALVMAGGIPLSAIAFVLTKNRKASLLNVPLHLPGTHLIDKRLIAGGLIFGIGWGLAGICPGPGLVLLGSGALKGIYFVGAMLIGMFVFEILERITVAKG